MPPNHRLRTARERAHLTRDELAEAVALWLANQDAKGREVAFDANHLGKIERGVVARPRKHYVKALCAVLQADEIELGFRGTPEDVDRIAFLRAALGAGAGSLLALHFPGHDATDLVAAIAGPTAHYGRLGDVVSTIELSPAVEAHLRLASSVVTNVLPSKDGFAALSEAAVLAAWVARERGDTGTARRHYGEAARYAERAHHPLLTAFMLQSRGTFAVETGDARQGLMLLERAWRELEPAGAGDAAQAHLASWIAIAHAELGDRDAAVVELRKAESLIGGGRGEPRWPWVFAFDVSKAARYQASTFAKLDDLQAARSAFAAAAPALVAPRPRAHAQVDHARALARAGYVGEACALAGEAHAVGQQYGFERIIWQVRALRAELPANTRESAALDDALAGLYLG